MYGKPFSQHEILSKRCIRRNSSIYERSRQLYHKLNTIF